MTADVPSDGATLVMTGNVIPINDANMVDVTGELTSRFEDESKLTMKVTAEINFRLD